MKVSNTLTAGDSNQMKANCVNGGRGLDGGAN